MAPRIAARTPPASCHRSTSARAANQAADEGSPVSAHNPLHVALAGAQVVHVHAFDDHGR